MWQVKASLLSHGSDFFADVIWPQFQPRHISKGQLALTQTHQERLPFLHPDSLWLIGEVSSACPALVLPSWTPGRGLFVWCSCPSCSASSPASIWRYEARALFTCPVPSSSDKVARRILLISLESLVWETNPHWYCSATWRHSSVASFVATGGDSVCHVCDRVGSSWVDRGVAQSASASVALVQCLPSYLLPDLVLPPSLLGAQLSDPIYIPIPP